jgi:serine/threonine protein kinase
VAVSRHGAAAGRDLSDRLRRSPVTAEALDLAEDLWPPWAPLHDAGIVHRDLKPSNIFLTPHGAKLLDFGLARELPGDVARALATATEITRPGLIIGTPGYMAPEQILGHPVDARADLFAAGAVLYEALTGQRPFGEAPSRRSRRALRGSSPSPAPRRS